MRKLLITIGVISLLVGCSSSQDSIELKDLEERINQLEEENQVLKNAKELEYKEVVTDSLIPSPTPDPTAKSQPLPSQPKMKSCTYDDWNCNNWSDCSNGTQHRECKLIGNCINGVTAPETNRKCIDKTTNIDEGIKKKIESYKTIHNGLVILNQNSVNLVNTNFSGVSRRKLLDILEEKNKKLVEFEKYIQLISKNGLTPAEENGIKLILDEIANLTNQYTQLLNSTYQSESYNSGPAPTISPDPDLTALIGVTDKIKNDATVSMEYAKVYDNVTSQQMSAIASDQYGIAQELDKYILLSRSRHLSESETLKTTSLVEKATFNTDRFHAVQLGGNIDYVKLDYYCKNSPILTNICN